MLTRVALTDYGVYRGRNELDLSCAADRPVVLVGGLNGAGKTTLFESIKLCLYGMAALDRRTTRRAYEEFLGRKMHRGHGGAAGAERTSVEVSFKFFHNGQESEYRIVRSWSLTADGNGGVDEQLDVRRRRRGESEFTPLDTVDRPHWQQFIEGTIPRGVIQMFFFDGEEIVRMAKDGTESVTIRDSFRALLGLELVEQLRDDLQVNLTRNLTGGSKALREEFEAIKAEKEECGRATERLREKLAHKQTETDSLHVAIGAAEAQISGLGGGFAARRESAKKELEAAGTEHDAACQRLRELCSGALPFLLVPARLKRLRASVLEDTEIQRQRSGLDTFKSRVGAMLDMLDERRFREGAELGVEEAARAAALVSRIADGELKRDVPPDPPMGLSQAQAGRLLSTIDEAAGPVLKALRLHAAEAAMSAEQMARLESALASAPSDDEIGPLVSRLGRLHAQAGRIKAEADHIEEAISSNVALRHHLDAKMRDVVARIYSGEKSERAVGLTRAVQGVLEEFAGRLQAAKVRILEENLLESARVLLRKRDLIGRVDVDPSTFEVTLFKAGGDVLPKDTLSEGEKQMLATAVLWALARTSGRPLPFMIDTPLARLDGGHRDSIVEKFLPAASHQVIVLSTDEEIDEERHALLESHLARAYTVEYTDGEEATRCRRGYFWTEGRKVAAV